MLLSALLIAAPALSSLRNVARSTTLRASAAAAIAPPSAAKAELLSAIAAYNDATKSDGVPSVDFGVSGGELDKDSRAPRDLLKAGAYHAVSPKVGEAADRIIAAIEAIKAVNPTTEPTKGFGSREGSEVCPLHGRWFNKFSTAADATFSADSKRGGATVSNRVDAVSGRTTNIIEFTGVDHPAFRATRNAPKKPPLQSLNVVLSAKAVSPSRIELVFRYVKPRLNLKLCGRSFGLTLVVPVPGPFITRILFFFKPKKKAPPAYFDGECLTKSSNLWGGASTSKAPPCTSHPHTRGSPLARSALSRRGASRASDCAGKLLCSVTSGLGVVRDA